MGRRLTLVVDYFRSGKRQSRSVSFFLRSATQFIIKLTAQVLCYFAHSERIYIAAGSLHMFKTVVVTTVIAFFLSVSTVYADKAKPGKCGVGKYYDVKTKKCADAADKK